MRIAVDRRVAATVHYRVTAWQSHSEEFGARERLRAARRRERLAVAAARAAGAVVRYRRVTSALSGATSGGDGGDGDGGDNQGDGDVHEDDADKENVDPEDVTGLGERGGVRSVSTTITIRSSPSPTAASAYPSSSQTSAMFSPASSSSTLSRLLDAALEVVDQSSAFSPTSAIFNPSELGPCHTFACANPFVADAVDPPVGASGGVPAESLMY